MKKYMLVIIGVLAFSVVFTAVEVRSQWMGDLIYNRINLNRIDAVQVNISGSNNNSMNFMDASMQNCDLKTINGSVRCGVDAGGSDTNASTACAGTTTYLDGEGNCDDISLVYLTSETDPHWSGNQSSYYTSTVIENKFWYDDANVTCATVTGSADLCDGNDADTNTHAFNTTEEMQDACGALANNHLTYVDASNQLNVDDDWWDAYADFMGTTILNKWCIWDGSEIDCVNDEANITCTSIPGLSADLCDNGDANTQLTEEQVTDYAGGMWTGNTETRATVTFQDGDNTIDIVVDDMNDDQPDNDAEVPDDITVNATKPINTTVNVFIKEDSKLCLDFDCSAWIMYNGTHVIINGTG